MYNSNKKKEKKKRKKRTVRVSFSLSVAQATGEVNQSTAPVLNHRRPVDPFLETLEKLVKKPHDTLGLKKPDHCRAQLLLPPPPQISINYAHQSLLGETPTTERASYAGEVRGADKAKTPRKSPPPGPIQSLPKFNAEKDESWKLVTAHAPRAKRRALYVGNLGISTTESSLAGFVISRAAKAARLVQVHSVIFPQAHGRPTLFARILVDADISARVLSREVWCRPLYCWKWHYVAPFKDKTQETPSEGKDQEEAGTHSIAGLAPPPV